MAMYTTDNIKRAIHDYMATVADENNIPKQVFSEIEHRVVDELEEYTDCGIPDTQAIPFYRYKCMLIAATAVGYCRSEAQAGKNTLYHHVEPKSKFRTYSIIDIRTEVMKYINNLCKNYFFIAKYSDMFITAAEEPIRVAAKETSTEFGPVEAEAIYTDACNLIHALAEQATYIENSSLIPVHRYAPPRKPPNFYFEPNKEA